MNPHVPGAGGPRGIRSRAVRSIHRGFPACPICPWVKQVVFTAVKAFQGAVSNTPQSRTQRSSHPAVLRVSLSLHTCWAGSSSPRLSPRPRLRPAALTPFPAPHPVRSTFRTAASVTSNRCAAINQLSDASIAAAPDTCITLRSRVFHTQTCKLRPVGRRT